VDDGAGDNTRLHAGEKTKLPGGPIALVAVGRCGRLYCRWGHEDKRSGHPLSLLRFYAKASSVKPEVLQQRNGHIASPHTL